MTEEELQTLTSKYLCGDATPEEELLLHEWYEKSGAATWDVVVVDQKDGEDGLRQKLFNNIHSNIAHTEGRGYTSSSLRKHWLSYAAAVLLISAVCVYFLSNDKSPDKVYHTQLLKNDVGPGGNNAVLEMGNNAKINLDEVAVGTVRDLGGIVVNKLENGSVSLKISENGRSLLKEYRTIRTPKGGQYHIELPDGSKVWLNASSSIRFSSHFTDHSREVEMEGEAYFEISKVKNANGQRTPFLVKCREQRIEVLGTHFNVNSYDNEKSVKTSLMEGSVSVESTTTRLARTLVPGQECTVYDGKMTVNSANMDVAIAWKNGDFVFDNEDLESILRKLERWYDIDVVHSADLEPLRFSGAVSRSKNLSAVIKIMELTGKVKFKVEGRRVYVMT